MNPSTMAKCPCQHCGLNLEFPIEGAGMVIQCPDCQKETCLMVPDNDPATSAATVIPDESCNEPYTVNDILAAFAGPVKAKFTSAFYQFGLLVVALAMIILPIVYLAMIGAAGLAVVWWAKFGSSLLSGGGGIYVVLFKITLYIAPLFAGAVTVFFMCKPLFAPRPKYAQPLALNPVAEPVLFTFIAKVCEMVGAPAPSRIELDCQFNAAAGFRRGFGSFFSNDLVLTIGLPLVASLNMRQFAGVLAHEFGRFTQGFAMRLTYIIHRINLWFLRVVYQRDAWDVTLEEWAQTTEDWRAALVVQSARLGVWFSRLCLRLLMMVGNGINCFMSRQMEYDADYYQSIWPALKLSKAR